MAYVKVTKVACPRCLSLWRRQTGSPQTSIKTPQAPSRNPPELCPLRTVRLMHYQTRWYLLARYNTWL